MKKWIAYPYVIWNIIFIVLPLILILFFSFTTNDGGFKFTLENYRYFMQPIYLNVIWRSIKLAFIATIACLVLGYPVAIILAKAGVTKRNFLVLLFILPMWMNFLIRTYAWLSILGKNGFINSLLVFLGLPKVDLLYNSAAVVLGMVYNFLPFMVLPIYTTLTKMDKSLIEAAKDLGANKFKVFTKVVFPLSIPGVISGVIMVFMPAVSTFVISRLLGGGKYMLIGNLVEQEFLWAGDWHFGSAISIIMMIIIIILMAIASKYADEEGGGGGLW